MKADYQIGIADELPVLRSTISDDNGPVNLTGATCTLYIRKAGTSTTQSIVGVITSAVAGQVEYTFTAAKSTPAGWWWLMQRAEYAGANTLTVPTLGTDHLWINPFFAGV